MGLNRHTSSDGPGGNLGAELSYYIWSRISSGETTIPVSVRNRNLRSEQKSEFLLSPEEILVHM